MDYIFAFDVSDEAVVSGFLQSACNALKSVLYGSSDESGAAITPSSFPSSLRIAIITFDTALHFYDMTVGFHTSLSTIPQLNGP